MLYWYHAGIKKQEEYVDCRLQYGIVYHDCFAGSDGSDWALNDSKYTLCYVTSLVIECLRRVQDLIFYSVFLFLGSLWIIPYKAKSEISDILSSLPNNLVIIIVLFSSLIICGVGAGGGGTICFTEIPVITDSKYQLLCLELQM